MEAIGGALVTGMLNNEGASDRQDSANAFSAQQYATRYQTTVKDMEAAGLNPMLAYSGISGSPPTGAISSPGGYPDFGSVVNQAKVASAQAANIEADTENKAAQGELFRAQAAAALGSAGQANAQTDLINTTVGKTKAEIDNIQSTTEQVKAFTDNLRTMRDNLIKEGYNLTEVGNQLRMSVDKMRAEIPVLNQDVFLKAAQEQLAKTNAQLGGFDVEAARNMGNLGRQAGQAKPLFDIVRGLIRK